MAPTASFADRQPLGEINTTPLIDVLLVLLVMLVITIPIGSHSLEIPLPNGEGTAEIRPVNVIAIAPGDRLTWNGEAIGLDELGAVLAAAARQPAEPEVRFQPEAQASYGLSAEVLRRIKASGITAFGLIGTEQFSKFDAPPRR